ncbi:hypothetical protein D3C72_1290090 [compost metagenome]
MHAVGDNVVVEQAWRRRPQRVREFLAVLGEAERQVVRQRGHVFIRVVVLAHEDEDHAGDFLHRVGGQASRADQLVIRVARDGRQVAALEIEREAVIPAADGVLGQAHRLGGQTDATVNALVLQGKDLAVHAAQHDRNAADLDALHAVFRQFLAEQGRIPVVDKAPGRVLVRLVLTLHFGVIDARIADLVVPRLAAAPADDGFVAHLEVSSWGGCLPWPIATVRLKITKS